MISRKIKFTCQWGEWEDGLETFCSPSDGPGIAGTLTFCVPTLFIVRILCAGPEAQLGALSPDLPGVCVPKYSLYLALSGNLSPLTADELHEVVMVPHQLQGEPGLD